jgi:hypothetical protein
MQVICDGVHITHSTLHVYVVAQMAGGKGSFIHSFTAVANKYHEVVTIKHSSIPYYTYAYAHAHALPDLIHFVKRLTDSHMT